MSSAQSSLWKNSARIPASQVPAPSTNSAIKNLPQQQGRAPQGQTQISFGGSPRSTSAPSPFVTGSPTNSSISNTTGGSLRTTPMTSKAGHRFLCYNPNQLTILHPVRPEIFSSVWKECTLNLKHMSQSPL
ncbi:hypothetical protein CK203_071548 [Vitis vinifera]|uniref:Uncharacterized protein n=1 Tax=Vitis vinifera TaxID=29760 RepID=A0A438F4F8_VITVI|nr:hypothetical protein CK203_071548 [Vitis vinifera]